MNQHLYEFAKRNKGKISGRVIDVGSFDVNGSLRTVFPVTVGVDMREGPGVDQVCDVVDLMTTFGLESFDCVCSADALEHMVDWKMAMENMWGILKPNGILFLTMANPKKGRHGYPEDYIRMPLEMFLSMFKDCQVMDSFQGGPSLGAVVVKTGPLNLNIKPIPVP